MSSIERSHRSHPKRKSHRVKKIFWIEFEGIDRWSFELRNSLTRTARKPTLCRWWENTRLTFIIILTFFSLILGLQTQNCKVHQDKLQNLQLTAQDRSVHSREVAVMELNAYDGLSSRWSRNDFLVGKTFDSIDVWHPAEHIRRCNIDWNARVSRASRSATLECDTNMDHHCWHHRRAVPSRSRGVHSLEMWILQATKTRSNVEWQSWEEQRIAAVHKQVNVKSRAFMDQSRVKIIRKTNCDLTMEESN